MTEPEPESLATRFRRFAKRECAGKSPLYATLAHDVADDVEVLALCRAAGPGQPPANLLFGAVHFLLRREPAHPLAEYYPSLTETPKPAAEVTPIFRDFCRQRQTSITDLMSSRVVSTNEVNRCTALILAVRAAARAIGTDAFHLLEVGASAGLNLLWDRYRYDYGAAGQLGSPDADLTLTCPLRGDRRPDFNLPSPAIHSRVGVDRFPLDPADPDDRDWLLALVWPEFADRAARLDRALSHAAGRRVQVVHGDGVGFLPDHARGLPTGAPLCITHSFTFNQVDQAGADAFEAALTEAGQIRPVARVALEWTDRDAPTLDLTLYRGDRREIQRLALCDPHGAWLEWLV